MRARTASAARRSDGFSENCSSVISASRQGQAAGCPTRANKPANWIAGQPLEQDALCLDTTGRLAHHHQNPAVVHPQGAVLRMHREQLRCRLAEPVGLGTELLAEGYGVRSERHPSSR